MCSMAAAPPASPQHARPPRRHLHGAAPGPRRRSRERRAGRCRRRHLKWGQLSAEEAGIKDRRVFAGVSRGLGVGPGGRWGASPPSVVRSRPQPEGPREASLPYWGLSVFRPPPRPARAYTKLLGRYFRKKNPLFSSLSKAISIALNGWQANSIPPLGKGGWGHIWAC